MPPTAVRSGVVGLGLDVVRVTATWLGAWVPLAFVTQVWAGSQFSPGMGGGFEELITWVVVFGGAVVAMVAERLIHGRRPDAATVALAAAPVGFVAGVVVALVWFTTKGGPGPGDWFVGPGCAAAAVALRFYALPALRFSYVKRRPEDEPWPRRDRW